MRDEPDYGEEPHLHHHQIQRHENIQRYSASPMRIPDWKGPDPYADRTPKTAIGRMTKKCGEYCLMSCISIFLIVVYLSIPIATYLMFRLLHWILVGTF